MYGAKQRQTLCPNPNNVNFYYMFKFPCNLEIKANNNKNIFHFANRYQWTGNAGTHFWHAHTGLQKLDGIHGSIVVRQPPSKDPNSHLYDFDLTTHVMMLTDWMHEDAAERYPGRLAVNTGQDPESMLINGKGQFRDPNTGFMTNTPLEIFTMTPGRRYRFRMINSFSTVCPAQITIEGHGLTIIATDGEPVHPVNVNTVISFSGKFVQS
jgi:FtsP/CotA-like multicopper oxidase with cupredoxin domain